jgi:predicted nucleic acid-binding protein
VFEPGSAETRRALGEAERVATSLIAYAEMRAALARKYRSREINATAFARIKADFENDWNGFFVMPIDTYAVRSAGELAEEFGLRGYDAVHLAAAHRLSRETDSPVRFMCFDAALKRAASNLGLVVPNPHT